ncbi:glycoside hydrolase family 73 protein [Oenococcus sicerae]|nr:glucosaminidase domain-containing protein [Oenococcus sicerae]
MTFKERLIVVKLDFGKLKIAINKKLQPPVLFNMIHFFTALIILLLTCFVSFYVMANASLADKSTPSKQESRLIEEQKFIDRTAPYIQTRQRQDKILASITLAQMILESDWGKSRLASKYHNYFGVKSWSNDTKKSVKLETSEFTDGKWIKVKGNFAVYKNWQTSVYQHNRLFLKGTTWNKNQYKAVLDAKNYVDGAQALVKSAYATDPDYASKIIRIIKKYYLNIYD